MSKAKSTPSKLIRRVAVTDPLRDFSTYSLEQKMMTDTSLGQVDVKIEAMDQAAKVVTSPQSAKTETMSQSAKSETMGQPAKTETMDQAAKTETMGQPAKSETMGQSKKSETMSQASKTETMDQAAKAKTSAHAAMTVTSAQASKTVTMDQATKTETMDLTAKTVPSAPAPKTITSVQSAKSVASAQAAMTVLSAVAAKTVPSAPSPAPKTITSVQSAKSVALAQAAMTVPSVQATQTVPSARAAKTVRKASNHKIEKSDIHRLSTFVDIRQLVNLAGRNPELLPLVKRISVINDIFGNFNSQAQDELVSIIKIVEKTFKEFVYMKNTAYNSDTIHDLMFKVLPKLNKMFCSIVLKQGCFILDPAIRNSVEWNDISKTLSNKITNQNSNDSFDLSFRFQAEDLVKISEEHPEFQTNIKTIIGVNSAMKHLNHDGQVEIYKILCHMKRVIKDLVEQKTNQDGCHDIFLTPETLSSTLEYCIEKILKYLKASPKLKEQCLHCEKDRSNVMNFDTQPRLTPFEKKRSETVSLEKKQSEVHRENFEQRWETLRSPKAQPSDVQHVDPGPKPGTSRYSRKTQAKVQDMDLVANRRCHRKKQSRVFGLSFEMDLAHGRPSTKTLDIQYGYLLPIPGTSEHSRNTQPEVHEISIVPVLGTFRRSRKKTPKNRHCFEPSPGTSRHSETQPEVHDISIVPVLGRLKRPKKETSEHQHILEPKPSTSRHSRKTDSKVHDIVTDSEIGTLEHPGTKQPELNEQLSVFDWANWGISSDRVINLESFIHHIAAEKSLLEGVRSFHKCIDWFEISRFFWSYSDENLKDIVELKKLKLHVLWKVVQIEETLNIARYFCDMIENVTFIKNGTLSDSLALSGQLEMLASEVENCLTTLEMLIKAIFEFIQVYGDLCVKVRDDRLYFLTRPMWNAFSFPF